MYSAMCNTKVLNKSYHFQNNCFLIKCSSKLSSFWWSATFNSQGYSYSQSQRINFLNQHWKLCGITVLLLIKMYFLLTFSSSWGCWVWASGKKSRLWPKTDCLELVHGGSNPWSSLSWAFSEQWRVCGRHCLMDQTALKSAELFGVAAVKEMLAIRDGISWSLLYINVLCMVNI